MSEHDKQNIVSKITQENKVEYILDAIIYLSGCADNSIRTTAFSTLSYLSKYSSTCPSTKA